MKAYVRPTFKRLAEREVKTGLEEAFGPGRRAPAERGYSPSPGVPEFWGVFARVFEAAAEASAGKQGSHQDGRLARCGRFDVVRTFGCGSSAAAFEDGAWCSLPHCPACAQRRATHGFRAVRDAWPERIVSAEVWVDGGEEGAPPAPDVVASLRAAWGRIAKRAAQLTGFAPVEGLPRTFLEPGAVSFFAPLPWASGDASEPAPSSFVAAAEETLVTGLRQAAREEGLVLRPRVVSREAAALRVRDALSAESRRFQEDVGADLARIATLDWRGAFASDASLETALQAAARRWVERVRSRHRSRRRQTVLGARHALPIEADPGVSATRDACPEHGGACAAVAIEVRDQARGGRAIYRGEGERGPAARAPAIDAFLGAAIAAADAEHERIADAITRPPAPLVRMVVTPTPERAIASRFRMAG